MRGVERPGEADIALEPGVLVTQNLRLVRQLSAGGMGRVWIAEHVGLRTHVVVKFMLEELASLADARARFEREAAAASHVKSPHVVHMIDYGITPSGLPYIAMELLEGQDLRQVMKERGTLPPREVASIVGQVSRALMAAHQKGIVHRDIKPENIFLTDDGNGELFVKVLDFGIAKAVFGNAFSSTSTGAMIGSPYYMSPEQVLGQKTIDHRSDLWSLAVVAFESLTGQAPYSGDTLGAISVAICQGTAPKPSSFAPQLGNAIDAWFLRACARDPAERFSTAKELAEALARAVGVRSDLVIMPPGQGDGRLPTESGLRFSHAQLSAPAQPDAGTTAPHVTSNSASSMGGSITAGRTSAVKRAVGNPGPVMVILALLGVGLLAGGGFYIISGVRAPALPAEVGPVAALQAPAPATSNPVPSPTLAAASAAELSVRASPAESRLFFDDAPLDSNPFAGRFPKDGLTHRVRAEASGHVSKVELVKLDRDVVLEITLVPVVAASVAPPAARAPGRSAPAPAAAPPPRQRPKPKLDSIQ